MKDELNISKPVRHIMGRNFVKYLLHEVHRHGDIAAM
jgi:hypothetical protein